VTGVLLAVALAVGVYWLDAPSTSEMHRPATRVQPPLVAEDSSGHGHDGVNQGRPDVGLPGVRGTSYSFDQDGSWVQIPSTPRLNPQTRDFLYSAWINFDHRPVRRETYDIIRKGLAFSSGGDFKLEIVPPGRIKCSAKDSSGYLASITNTETDVADGRWHHVGCARTGRTWSVGVDGVRTSEPTALGRVGNTVALSLGSKYGREDAVAGRVDHVVLAIGAPGEPEEERATERGDRLRQLRKLHVVGLWRLDETVETVVVGQ
jgi:hypothetical protein